jgi:hypothetical protein
MSGCVILTLALLSGGCSDSKTVKPKGQLVKNGQPVQVAEGDYYIIVLVPEAEPGKEKDAPKNQYPASKPAPDGTFTVEDAAGKGIPPGKYKVTIKKQEQPKPSADGRPQAPPGDGLNNRYDERNTKLTWDLTTYDGQVKPFDIGK